MLPDVFSALVAGHKASASHTACVWLHHSSPPLIHTFLVPVCSYSNSEQTWVHLYHRLTMQLYMNRIFHCVWLLPWWRGVTGRSLAGFWWHIQGDIENCEGWLSPSGHSSGGRALTTKVRGPRFNPGWLSVIHSSLNIFPSLSSCTSQGNKECRSIRHLVPVV